MTSLRKENVKKCFSLLKEYLEEAPGSKKKGGAILALDQLRKITAGVGMQDVFLTSDSPACVSHPRANGTPAGSE